MDINNLDSIKRFKEKFGVEVSTDSFLNALALEPQYVYDIVNDNKLSSVVRSELLELFSKVYSKDLFSYVKSKLTEPDELIRSMAIETLIRYALNGHVDHAIVEAAVYSLIKDENNEELKEHLSTLYESLSA